MHMSFFKEILDLINSKMSHHLRKPGQDNMNKLCKSKTIIDNRCIVPIKIFKNHQIKIS